MAISRAPGASPLFLFAPREKQKLGPGAILPFENKSDLFHRWAGRGLPRLRLWLMDGHYEQQSAL